MRKLTVLWGNLMRFLGLACLVVGIVTAATQEAFAGFTPIVWLLVAVFCMVIVVCTGVGLTRDFLEGKKEK